MVFVLDQYNVVKISRHASEPIMAAYLAQQKRNFTFVTW